MGENPSKKRIDQLEEHLRNDADKVTPDTVADNSYYSYRHANRLFTTLKGESIKRYSNKMRMQSSAEYLIYTTISIFDIALLSGYESTAAYSKAFKKYYQQSPSAFRKNYSEKHKVEEVNLAQLEYSVESFKESPLDAFKIVFDTSISEDEHFSKIKAVIHQLDLKVDHWVLLWEEDPELCQLSESRYFLALNPKASRSYQLPHQEMALEGEYATFDTAHLEDYPYEVWHALAYSRLHKDGIVPRMTNYIEWYAGDSYQSMETFLPVKVGIPI